MRFFLGPQHVACRIFVIWEWLIIHQHPSFLRYIYIYNLRYSQILHIYIYTHTTRLWHCCYPLAKWHEPRRNSNEVRKTEHDTVRPLVAHFRSPFFYITWDLVMRSDRGPMCPPGEGGSLEAAEGEAATGGRGVDAAINWKDPHRSLWICCGWLCWMLTMTMVVFLVRKRWWLSSGDYWWWWVSTGISKLVMNDC